MGVNYFGTKDNRINNILTKLTIMKNIFFTSDLHLNHRNICKGTSTWADTSKCRDFDTIDSMNEHILQNINKHVKEHDDLYILGDFCMGGHARTPEWRNSIVCRNVHIISGNHDPHINQYNKCFSSVNKALTITHLGVLINMFHFPLYTWEDMHKGSYMLHGHEHGNINEDNMDIRRLDVGIDSALLITGEYRPFDVEEIHKILSKRPMVEKGHHKIVIA